MEDRRGTGFVIESDSKASRRKRSNEELGGKTEILRKRSKMRDLESVFRFEGSEHHRSKSSMIREVTNKLHQDKKVETFQITDEPVTKISDNFQTVDAKQNTLSLSEDATQTQITDEPVTKISDNFQTVDAKQNTLSLSEDATRLSLGHFSSPPRSMDLNAEPCIFKDTGHNDAPANVGGFCKPFMLTKHLTDHDSNSITSRRTWLDLNAEEVCSSVYHDQFLPQKSHGHLKSMDVSECGSSTGPLDEKESLRVWKEMKQNGFLSSSHGGIPIPKQRGRKSKNDTLKRKMELAKREQVNRFSKIAAPSGLLNELNPGIINHVRNSKQVHSIIKAIVRFEKLENSQMQSRPAGNLKRTKEMNDRSKDMENIHDSETSQLYVSYGNESGNDSDETNVASHIMSDCDHETFPPKLSSTATMASMNASFVSNEALENQATVSSLSMKSATVASQWLEIIHQDIRGRLSALRRSKKRVQAVIQTELPFLLSKELSSTQENDTYASQSSFSECSNPLNVANPETHQTKWTALFEQMEKALSEEGRHLESWLNQVTEMRLHCQRGLQSINWFAGHGLPQVGRSEIESRLKNTENSVKNTENSVRELATRAVAASIYSTCNYAMSTENVSCF